MRLHGNAFGRIGETVASQPSPAAWIAGIATQTSAHRPTNIGCLRPVA